MVDQSLAFSDLRFPVRQRSAAPNSVSRIRVEPTGQALGAIVHGVDLVCPLDEATVALIRAAWDEHLVLLFRDQVLAPREFRDAARIFGVPQEGAHRKYIRSAGGRLHDDLPEVAILSNLDANGRPAEVNDGLGSLEVVWHSDNSYIAEPPMGSALYALEVPTHSGETSFANQYLAYETLPDALKRAIAGRVAKHDASRNSAGILRPGLHVPTTPEEVPGPLHPLVILHPRTQRPALYLGRRRIYPSQFIDGLPHEESERLLDQLWRHATQPELAWTHDWRVGDLLVWDNRAALHHRTPVDAMQRRVMLRTQFEGAPIVAA
jgi:taurine dioxygenase